MATLENNTLLLNNPIISAQNTTTLTSEWASLLWYHPAVFGFRRMFTFVGVAETSFEKVEDVPDYVQQVYEN